ncbi:ATP-dependent protease subunit HslV [Reyranella sp.]|jgi:ATP-dependent HslUV protease subunit HslV|uniref:ATP-dependent protease subunit HslV n=1 Tax=Reyranella sp. TaxID=1929291 RepID=UPI000BC9EC15|nr:ATP-dependent protease subunit HslV [Reyranella sp.]OYY41561.1 MAG: HslU--HslV peptidase proteolytic subunit [Rhodospirillales bacterium 35-66-84]OYZ93407.1 MAG: HslU--HslV peptidase proteolytic subunit [Rhodospirillales bacterium 24-66-33]OZB24905.1 MAG: HslU--HslV peptidase proteolytic subunit [Rhodospirillales bacterium 39-66-50]HQS15561.1 ATP-dependent protease subunit HslV [Reyranella sp.]HQT12827.1 ATP-dependent protease subunit HslV [Reyranella sp.]
MSSAQSDSSSGPGWHATTILSVRKDGQVVMAGDGQVSMGQTIVKGNAKKVRRIGNSQIIAGFAGATADAFTLFERLEAKLERHPGQLLRAAIELAKDWRTDRYLRKLEALMAVADKDVSLLLSGTGDVLEPEGGIIAIGSGGNYALSAARALIDVEGLDAEAIARKSMKIAADICVYTNHNVVIEKL